jgi:Metallopeptidase toxin 3
MPSYGTQYRTEATDETDGKIRRRHRTHSLIRRIRLFGSMTSAQARSALLRDTDPLVTITDLSAGQCGVPAAVGCTRDTTHIEIDDDVVNEFEKNANDNLRLTKFGKHVFLTGVTLLHEMCHWGNRVNGVVEADGDAGEKFENAVYGGVVN